MGQFGYFPSYALGSFIAAQLHETLRTQSEHFDAEISSGRFGGLFEWLRQNVHGRGASVGAQELIRDATGKALSAAPWMRYAESKYLETEAEASGKALAATIVEPAAAAPTATAS